MNATAPILSIVVPAFRAESTIARTLGSVQKQFCELILVVDGPDSATSSIGNKMGCRVIELPSRKGACAARNQGLEIARGKYVLFLDADDYVEGPLLEAMLRSIEGRHPDIVFGPSVEEQDGARFNARLPDFADCQLALLQMADDQAWIPCCSVVWRTSFARSLGGWDETLACHQDVDFIFRGLAAATTIECIAEGLGVYCRDARGSSITSQRGPEFTDARVRTLLNFPLWRLDEDLRQVARIKLAKMHYRYAQHAFFWGHRELGDLSLRRSRELGYRGHLGTSTHRFMATLFGVRKKEEFLKIARKWLKKLKSSGVHE